MCPRRRRSTGRGLGMPIAHASGAAGVGGRRGGSPGHSRERRFPILEVLEDEIAMVRRELNGFSPGLLSAELHRHPGKERGDDLAVGAGVHGQPLASR